MRTVVVGVLIGLALLAFVSEGYVLKPTSLHRVGRAGPGKRLWRPDRALAFGPETAAVRMSTSRYECHEDGKCEYVTAWTADNGKTWQVEEGMDDYCGTAGIYRDDVLECLNKQFLDDGLDDVLSFGRHGFSINPAGLLSSASMVRKVLDGFATFDKPPTEDLPPKDIRAFGDKILPFEDHGLYFRNVALILANDTEAHALYKSTDGMDWKFVSFIPIPFGLENVLIRSGDTKLLIVAGEPGNYSQAESIYMGLHWEKVTQNQFATLMNSYTSPYYTSIYTGLRGLPGLYAAATGSKKGSEKPINIADLHNRLVRRLFESQTDKALPSAPTNFSKDFLTSNVSEFTCPNEPHSTDPAEGCESSSDATIASTQNGTVFLFYDKLKDGFGPAKEEGGHEVYAMRLSLNETKEAKDQEERLEKERQRKEQERVYEEARIKAEKEAAERRKRERREKKRKDKERRAQYALRDQPNLDRAAKETELDDEYIVVRDVDQQWVDLEKDLY